MSKETPTIKELADATPAGIHALGSLHRQVAALVEDRDGAIRNASRTLQIAEAELAERSADIRTLAAQRAAANARAEKAEEHRDKLLEAWKPDPLCGHAFVAGARWWQSHVVGATPFPSETDEMESEAAKRYPFAPHPIVIDLEEKAARLAAECRADRMCTGAQSSMEFAEFSCTRKAARAAVDAAGDLTEGGTA